MKIFCFLIFVFGSLSAFSAIDSSSFKGSSIQIREDQISYIDANGVAEIENLLSREVNKQNNWTEPKSLNFGYGPSPKWFRLEINNTDLPFVIKYLSPMMQIVKMYLLQDGKVINYKFGGKKFENDTYRGVLLESDLQGPQVAYIYLESTGPFQVPISIGTHDMVHKKITFEYLALGSWLGLIATLMIFYFIIYLKLHDSIYLYFSLYGIPLLLINLSFSGLFYQYFPDFYPYLKARLVVVSIGLMLVFLTMFTKHFFEIHKQSGLPKIIHHTITACIVIPAALSIINMISYTTFTISLTGLLGIIVPLLLILIAFYMLIKRQNGSYLYIIATGSFLVGFIIYCLKDFSFLPNNSLTSDSIFYTSALEMMLLAFAIANKFRDIQLNNEDLIKTVIMKENSAELATVAHQLAHDIRSPLEVLKSLKSEVSSLPETSRRRISMSINRIEEITFNLLKNHREKNSLNSASFEDLLTLVSSVLAEKEIEYRQNEKIQISGIFDSSSYGLFSKINRTYLKNIISNLINNSVEAIGANDGAVEVHLFSDEFDNIIKITDSGGGIPESLWSNVFNKGFTTKKTGNGLGIFTAKKEIESVGGSITFQSQEGKGTTFTISLPKSEAPDTFIGVIETYNYERIIVLDDDPAFHEVWSKRFEGLEDIVEHIYSVEEMFSKYQALHPKILLLSDFELMDKDYDGIDTIIKLNHAKHSVLVTARNEELEIQERCLKAGIKLLPKSLVNYVMVRKTGMPMITGREGVGEGLDLAKDLSESSQAQFKPASMVGEDASNQPLVILIDDDKLVRLNWSSFCDKKGIPFREFSSIDAFLEVSSSIPKEAKIYIDSNLGDGIKGEIESEKIFNLGFKNLYLPTGYGKEYIQKPSWIIEVYSKGPEVITII